MDKCNYCDGTSKIGHREGCPVQNHEAQYKIFSYQSHLDDRAYRAFLPLQEFNGQINWTTVHSTNSITAFHKHEKQTDYWFCIKGSFKCGLAIPLKQGGYEVQFVYLSDKQQKVLKIPPKIYHGYKALEPGSIMGYYLSEKYSIDDEWKVRPGYFGESWDIEDK